MEHQQLGSRKMLLAFLILGALLASTVTLETAIYMLRHKNEEFSLYPIAVISSTSSVWQSLTMMWLTRVWLNTRSDVEGASSEGVPAWSFVSLQLLWIPVSILGDFLLTAPFLASLLALELVIVDLYGSILGKPNEVIGVSRVAFPAALACTFLTYLSFHLTRRLRTVPVYLCVLTARKALVAAWKSAAGFPFVLVGNFAGALTFLVLQSFMQLEAAFAISCLLITFSNAFGAIRGSVVADD